jgi:hypothetical protein
MAKRTCSRCKGLTDDLFSTFTLGLIDGGSGQVDCWKCDGQGRLRDGRLCHGCNGNGRRQCPKCHGTGFVGG